MHSKKRLASQRDREEEINSTEGSNSTTPFKRANTGEPTKKTP